MSRMILMDDDFDVHFVVSVGYVVFGVLHAAVCTSHLQDTD